MLGIRGRSLDFWVADAASKDVVEDLLTHPIPPHSANAPPTFDIPLTPTALTPSDTAVTLHGRFTDKATSKVPSKPLLLLELKDEDEPLHKQTRRSNRLTRPPVYTRILSAVGDLEFSDFKPSVSEPSEFKGFRAAASEVYASDDLGDDSDIAMLDDLVYNPMFDPDAVSIRDLTGEGNRELAEDDDDNILDRHVEKFAHIPFDAIKSSGPLLLDDRSGSRQSRSKQALVSS
ncbi:MAG: hypothetical protein Q9192_006614 [Flavoplaca navasiana]